MYDRSRVDKYCLVLAKSRSMSLYQFYVSFGSDDQSKLRVVYRRLKVISLFEKNFI